MSAVTRIGNEKEGMFSLNESAEMVGTLTYKVADDSRMIIEHTNVEKAHEGKGFGKQLVEAAANFARDKKYKIIPACGFAKKVLTDSDEYSDLLG